MKLSNANAILVVDDETNVRYFIAEGLRSEGYQVDTAASGHEALDFLQETSVDVAIVDLQMPGLNGLDLMSAMQNLPDVPELIMLTAHATLETSIEAMRRGGTDFLLKPCDIDELLHSVEQAMHRRQKTLKQRLATRLLAETLGLDGPRPGQPRPPVETTLHERGLAVNPTAMTATKHGQDLGLTPTEFKLLTVLMQHPEQAYSFQELADIIHDQQVDEHQARDMLKSHIGRLRRKVGADPAGQPYIVNVRGVGYKFTAGE